VHLQPKREHYYSTGNEIVPKIIINDKLNLFFKTAISIFVISNHNSFRVLFDKIAYVSFIWKIYLYFCIGNGQPREPALCQLFRHIFVPYDRGIWSATLTFEIGFDLDKVTLECLARLLDKTSLLFHKLLPGHAETHTRPTAGSRPLNRSISEVSCSAAVGCLDCATIRIRLLISKKTVRIFLTREGAGIGGARRRWWAGLRSAASQPCFLPVCFVTLSCGVRPIHYILHGLYGYRYY